MIKFSDIIDAENMLVDNWGDDGREVIRQIYLTRGEMISLKDFLSHCSPCGGNWGGMLLTGIKELYPKVWEAIPEDMGINAWGCICHALLLLGVDTSEE